MWGGSGGAGFCLCGYDLRPAIGPAGSESFRLFGTTFQGSRIVESPASQEAKRQFRRSMVLAAAAPLVLLAVLLLNGFALAHWILPLALSSYLAWGSYWGTVGVIRMFSERKVSRWAIELAARHASLYGLLLPVLIGVLYGVLGGGVYEFQRARRIVKNPGLPL